MKRRKFIAGLGALATGSAAAIGTGAFTSLSVSRNVSVSVSPDSNAYLQLKPLSTPNSNEFVDGSGGRSDTLSISIGENKIGGKGVNEQAETFFDDLFSITNQGSQPVWIWMKSNIPGVNYYNSDIDEGISLDGNNVFNDREVIQYVEVGDGFNVGLTINTVGRPSDRDGQSTIIAKADEEDVPDEPGHAVQNSDRGGPRT
ncbi:hypothetical protein [Halorubrum sodomense]|uniref:hypothetical protein n=1 Tax=Halorubrum sodomense TaxID=35743 RepID=UPI00116088CD|nr:hypothetical protein [Halorubrum sodomense]